MLAIRSWGSLHVLGVDAQAVSIPIPVSGVKAVSQESSMAFTGLCLRTYSQFESWDLLKGPQGFRPVVLN